MKRFTKFFGIAAIFAVIGFLALPLTGCPEDDGGDPPPPPVIPAQTPQPPANDTPITSVSLTIGAPSEGVAPATTATTSGTVNFTSGIVTWSPDVTSTFTVDVVYTATVTLTANSGYTFEGLTAANAKINSQTATISDNTGATVTLSFTFPATLPEIAYISILSQPSNLSYTQDGTLNLTGIVVQLYFLVGEPRNVPLNYFLTYNVTTIPANGDKLSVADHHGQKITVQMGDKTVETSGTLTVTARAPTIDDFIVSSGTREFTYDGTVKSVSVTADPDKTSGMGAITVKYDNSTTAPTDAKATPYTVTFDVAANTNYTALSLSAGTLTINKATPVLAHYDINLNLTQFVTSVSNIADAVAVTLKTPLEYGTATVYYEGTGGTEYTKSATKPTKVGSFTVTVDVAAGTNNTAATLNPGTLEINVFRTIPALGTWLSGQAANSAATAFPVALKVSDLGGPPQYGSEEEEQQPQTVTASFVLKANSGKYVSLDLSGSTFTSIVQQSLYQCTNLTGIILPNSVTSIGDFAFFGCTNLAGIIIPNSVTSIGVRAFSDCTNLASVTLPTNANFTKIEDYAFNSCTNLASIIIPSNVTSIGYQAFYFCTNLTSVTFQGNDYKTLNYAFMGLDDRYGYASNWGNNPSGGVGTYTTTAPVPLNGAAWTKQ